MNSRLCLPAAFALTLGLLLSSGSAEALGPIDVEVAALGGYGTNPSAYSPNPLGVELGVRAGISFQGFYGGLTFLYGLGGTTNGSINPEGIAGAETLTSAQYGLDLGYSFKLPMAPLTIRPQLEFGDYSYTPSGVGFCGEELDCTTSYSFYFQPGVTALFWIGHHLFAGVDVNAFIIPFSSTDSGTAAVFAITAHAQFGVHF